MSRARNNGRVDLAKMRRIGHLRRTRVRSHPDEPAGEGVNVMLRILLIVVVVIIIIALVIWLV